MLFSSNLPWERRGWNVLLALLSLVTSAVGFMLMARQQQDTGQHHGLIVAIVAVNALLLTVLCVLVTRQILGMLRTVRLAGVGLRLHRKVALAFALVAVLPSVVVLIFAGYLFYFGVQGWFAPRVADAVNESMEVAEAYLAEHRQTIRADILAMASELNRESPFLINNSMMFNRFLTSQSNIRSLSEAVVFQPNKMLARSALSFSFTFDKLSMESLRRADAGEVVMLDDDDNDQVRALVRLDMPLNTYLLVGRFIDPKVIGHVERTRGAVSDYKVLQKQSSVLQWRLFGLFMLVAVVMLVMSLWFGMGFATDLIASVSALADAAERVRAGDLTARVPNRPNEDELAMLGHAFNRMTEQLKQQREEILDANQQLDARRRFIEAVLTGVSSSVVALDAERRITLHNRAASQLIGSADEDLSGQELLTLMPMLGPLLEKAASDPETTADGQLEYTRSDKGLVLLVRVAAEQHDEAITGYVVTFDDITELQTAQRRAAWSNVARRIAHEIKNPLTPIQLAAERLRRKWGRHMEGEDRDLFEKYTETIVRHVGDIGRMVEEFVSFARMPAPQMALTDLNKLIRDTVFSEEVRHEQVAYVLKLPTQPVEAMVDPSQMRRALSNIIKNAIEALDGVAQPSITVQMRQAKGNVLIVVQDNGPGFPRELMSQLTEPYITTRQKGTGLGLAIVKKIIEDHKGRLELANGTKGAKVTVTLPLPAPLKAA